MTLNRLVGAVALGATTLTAWAGNGQDLLKQQCVACHAVTRPENASLERLWERKGPDLHYAGSKFNREWLVSWLQNPTTLRPGGVMYSKVVKASASKEADVIDTTKLTEHMKLSKDDAALAADALMALKDDALVEKGGYKNGPVNASFASMLFSKLRGCTSCHAVKPGSGGASAPEMYTAGDRLQPDFVVAYMKDPQKFDPHVWMPKLDLNDGDVQKLAGYITTLKSSEKK